MSRPAGVPEEAPVCPLPARPPQPPFVLASALIFSWDVPGLTFDMRALLFFPEWSDPIRASKKIEAYITALRDDGEGARGLELVLPAHARWHGQLDRPATRCAHRSVAERYRHTISQQWDSLIVGSRRTHLLLSALWCNTISLRRNCWQTISSQACGIYFSA